MGYFRPRGELRAGTKVRAGDRIGSVDVLGIGQDVVAPGDGLIGATLVAAGEPVEYGQAIIVLEQLTEPRLQPADAPAMAGTPRHDGVASPAVPTDATADMPDAPLAAAPSRARTAPKRWRPCPRVPSRSPTRPPTGRRRRCPEPPTPPQPPETAAAPAASLTPPQPTEAD